jgi:hypothetical protein
MLLSIVVPNTRTNLNTVANAMKRTHQSWNDFALPFHLGATIDLVMDASDILSSSLLLTLLDNLCTDFLCLQFNLKPLLLCFEACWKASVAALWLDCELDTILLLLLVI